MLKLVLKKAEEPEIMCIRKNINSVIGGLVFHIAVKSNS